MRDAVLAAVVPTVMLAIAATVTPATVTPARASSLDGMWGVTRGGAPDCGGLVMVLRDGRYTKALLDLGTTRGKRDSIAGVSSYTVTGGRLEIAPSASLARPEPRQVFLWDAVADLLVRREPAPRITYGRCPDRPLNPMTR